MDTRHQISPQYLGIDVKSKKEEELFKWFLACILFSKPIQEKLVINAYHELINNDLTSSQKILNAGWDKLVELLDKAHYVRFDFSTATRILEICQKLEDRYQSKVSNILKNLKNMEDLEQRLESFKGIGPVTAKFFIEGLS